MSMVVPVIMLGVMVWGIACQVDVWSTLVEGGAQGLQTAVRMVPSLVGLLCGVYMLRASGALELLEGLIAPVLGLVGIPPETVGLLVVRPISGSAALGLGAELIETYGPDSLVGHRDHLLHGGGVLWGGKDQPHPLRHSGGPVRGCGGLSGRQLGGKVAVWGIKKNGLLSPFFFMLLLRFLWGLSSPESPAPGDAPHW